MIEMIDNMGMSAQGIGRVKDTTGMGHLVLHYKGITLRCTSGVRVRANGVS